MNANGVPAVMELHQELAAPSRCLHYALGALGHLVAPVVQDFVAVRHVDIVPCRCPHQIPKLRHTRANI